MGSSLTGKRAERAICSGTAFRKKSCAPHRGSPRLPFDLAQAVTRYEYYIENFLGMVRLGCMRIMLRYL
jgi:hypothetical protein